MLSIKDPEAHKLARALARETGETMTRAVAEALRERLQRVRRGRDAETLKTKPVEHAELLYDEHGSPR